MNIVSYQYNLKRKTLEIYLSGCYGNCLNCQNSELKDFNLGQDYKNELKKIEKKIKKSRMVDEIWLLGGDPLDQNHQELLNFLQFLYTFEKPIWLWTRYELLNIPNNIKKYCTYIKTGFYDQSKPEIYYKEYDLKLASNNQKIFKISN